MDASGTPTSPASEEAPPAAPAKRPIRWRMHIIGITTLIVAGAAHFWFSGGKYRFFPKRFQAVEGKVLYRSGQLHPALLEETLQEHGIQIVLDLCEDVAGDEEDEFENAALARMGLRNIDIPGLDGSGRGDPGIYVQAVKIMVEAQKANTPLLVHCAAGTQRTGGAVGLFRMYIQGWEGHRAYDEYLDVRGKADSFKLMRFLNTNMPEIVKGLKSEGLIDAVPDPLPVFAPKGHPGT